MDFYSGLGGGSDKPQGGGSYVREQGFGHEVFNFRREADGLFRGYVRPPGQGSVSEQGINIDRLGATSGADRVNSARVFWVATHPVLGGTRVVGWYDDATVYRRWQPSPTPRQLPNGEDAGFMVESSVAHLVPSDDRLLVLPRASQEQTGIGQSNVWYPGDEWTRKLLEYASRVVARAPIGEQTTPLNRPALARMADTEARLRIERAAMDAAAAWCAERGLPCKDVSLKKVGWDLEAGEGKGILRIEVKGSSLQFGDALLELTPNEFAKMTSDEFRASYRLAIVSVQSEKSDLAMFAWSNEAGAWIAEGGRFRVRLHEVVAARVEVIRDQ